MGQRVELQLDFLGRCRAFREAEKFRRTNPVAGTDCRSYSLLMALTRELMIDRMLSSDAAYNGRFLTGVLSTGIYCLPSCPARKPKPENVRFFQRPEEAEAAGLRACKRCRPQHFYRDHDPDREMVEDLVERISSEAQAFANVSALVRDSGIGSSKLGELFHRHYHTTPSEMLCRRRIDLACRQLREDADRPIADIAFGVGFETLSVFNDNFRRLKRLSPQSYRRLANTDSFEIELPRYFLTDRVLAYLGRDPASLTERVAGQKFSFGTSESVPAIVHVEFERDVARCRVERPGGGRSEGDARAIQNTALHDRVLRFLGLVIDPRPFERRAARDGEIDRLIRGRHGLSIPQTPTIFDALVWVIAGQQVSLPVAFAMRRRLTRHVGVKLDDTLYAPPTPQAVAELEPSDLHQLGYSRRKAEYLLDIARAITDGSFKPDDLVGRSATAIGRELLAIRGLGPWSVNYLMMRAFGFVDCVPIGDAALTRNLKRFFDLATRPDAHATRQLMVPFTPHRSLATFHLWALKEESQ